MTVITSTEMQQSGFAHSWTKSHEQMRARWLPLAWRQVYPFRVLDIPLYPEGDPRALSLLAAFSPPRQFERTAGIVRITTGQLPNLDFALLALSEKCQLAYEAPFSISRSAIASAGSLILSSRLQPESSSAAERGIPQTAANRR
jgi:hypothetical protein